MLLEVQGLCVNYGHIEAIRDITFGVEEGEVTALIDETQQLIRIFYQSIRTVRSRRDDSTRVKEDARDAPDWMLDVGCWMLDVQGKEEAPP